jgi:hypothetical protein
MITKWGDKLNFGKYWNLTVEEVFYKDATYLIWAMKNTNRMLFPEEMTSTIKKQADIAQDEKNVIYDRDRDLDGYQFDIY